MVDILITPFWNSQEGRVRSLWRLLPMALVFFFFLVIRSVIIGITDVAPQQGMLIVGHLMMLVATIISIVIAGLVLDRRRFIDFGLHLNKNWWLDLGFGLALGALLMAGIFMTEWIAGWITITGAFVPHQPEQSFILGILVPLAVFLCVGIQEEMVSRGYLLRNMAEGLNFGFFSARGALILAWLLSSVVFGLLHAANPNATTISTINLMLAGLFLGLGYVLTGELAIPIGLHITWNFFQGNVFGFPVSGWRASQATFLAIEQSGPERWTGGAFGPEAGLIGIIAILIGSLLTLVWVRARYGHVTLVAGLAYYPGS